MFVSDFALSDLALYMSFFSLEKKTDHEEKAEEHSENRGFDDSTVVVSSGTEACEVINDNQNATCTASDTTYQDPTVNSTSEVFMKIFWDYFC